MCGHREIVLQVDICLCQNGTLKFITKMHITNLTNIKLSVALRRARDLTLKVYKGRVASVFCNADCSFAIVIESVIMPKTVWMLLAEISLAASCAVVPAQGGPTPEPGKAIHPRVSDQSSSRPKAEVGNGRKESPIADEPLVATPSSEDEERKAPRITFAEVPARQPESLSMRERLELGATLALVLICYAGAVVAVRAFAKLDRRMQANEAAIEALGESSSAILAGLQGQIAADRPWLTIGIDPYAESAGAFRISMTNRGRRAAEVTSIADRVGILKDQSSLPPEPTYTPEGVRDLTFPKMILPGEVVELQTIGRIDFEWICKSAESRRSVEIAREHIFVYGRVTYRDVISGDSIPHETNWCCKYVTGPNGDKLVKAGPREYNYFT